MTFKTYGEKNNPNLFLLPGLGVSYEIFLPLIGLLQDKFHIIAAGVDGFLLGHESRFTSVDDQASQSIGYVKENLGGHLDCAYGLSLGGKILSRMLERNEIVIDHAVMDAAPLLPLPKWSVDPLRYYQSLNVWTCYHWTGFWKWVFHSHYFDVLLDECRKVWPYGKGKAVRDGYKDVYTHKLESIYGDDIHYWYGTKEAFVARPQAEHLLTLCPEAHIEIFQESNHGQLLVDHPEEVARRIQNMTSIKHIDMTDQVTIVFEEDLDRSAAYDGNKQIGECEYITTGNTWSITHTGVREEYGGRGIARQLVLKVIEAARAKGVKINPVCSYAQKMMIGKEEFQDLL